MERQTKIRSFTLVAVFILAVWVWFPFTRLEAVSSNDCYCLQVSFLDVGQGDAIYIKSPEGFDALIDGGPDSSVLRSLAVAQSLNDRTLDVVIATHTDADHVGGLIDIFERYKVGTAIETTNQNDTSIATAYDAASAAVRTLVSEVPMHLYLGSSTRLTILSPAGDETNWESNTSSIVVLVEFGDTSFLLTGDAPAGIETYLVNAFAPYLQSEVLKLGHHGSKTSSDAAFLAAVDPEYAIVSAGADNRYGHPHPEVIDRVEATGATILETAKEGTITFYSDGKTISRESVF
jgi:competence protein ComEC